MKDILLKRNELKKNAKMLRNLKFDDELSDKDVNYIFNEQKKLDKKFNFYDKFIKAREEVKSEKKKLN